MTEIEKQVVLNKISEKLEQGWVLLQKPCPNCSYPLVQHKDQGTFCAKEGAFVISEEQAKALNIKASKMAEEPDSFEAELQEASKTDYGELGDDFEDYYAKRLEHVDRASSAIGEYLLKGWTMLATSCPTCGSPLMSLRGGTETCVVCKAMEKNKPQPKARPDPSPPKPVVKEETKPAPVKRAPEKVEIQTEPVQMASFDKMLEEEEIAREEVGRPQPPQRLEETHLPAKPLIAQERSNDLLQVLVGKLDFLRDQMHEAQDAKRITTIATAIKEVSDAIAAYKNIF